MKRCYSCFKEFEDSYSVCPFCGAVEDNEPQEPIHLVPGTILAQRYLLGKAVGAGGFGIVYKAYDLKLETIVAVKEFYVSRLVTRAAGLKNLIVSKKSQTEYEYRKERFLAEARNMAKFGSHRSIPNVFEFFEENNTAYIVMELLKGVALNDYLTQNDGKIDIDFALMIANEVGNALKSLHEQNIIHRDVAPDNIFICSGKDIRIKLMDLGAAKLADSTDEVIDIILKPGYSPPEQYDNSKNIGPWTDVYALGATLYAMLTDVKPDESTNRKDNKDIVVPPNQINPKISENLSNAIMKAMAIEKHMRFKNVNEFLEAINGERKVVTLAKERKRRGLKRAMGIIAACIVLCIGGLFSYNTYNDKKAEQILKPAEISVWFSVVEGSTEESAMESIKTDFEKTFPGVNLTLRAIPENEYENEITTAAKDNKLPSLFESTGLTEDILSLAVDLDNVIESEQFGGCLFLDNYAMCYSTKKQIPLAIEVPMACVITSGSTCIDYNDNFFSNVDNFGENVKIAFDSEYKDLVASNYGLEKLCDVSEFMNNQFNTSPVLLTSTMSINEIRNTLTNYQKNYVFPNNKTIKCNYIYEWSIGAGNKNEIKAAERLLSWMLGNVYQNTLMISKCNDGQIPINKTCFDAKIESKNLSPIKEVYKNFSFECEDENR